MKPNYRPRIDEGQDLGLLVQASTACLTRRHRAAKMLKGAYADVLKARGAVERNRACPDATAMLVLQRAESTFTDLAARAIGLDEEG